MTTFIQCMRSQNVLRYDNGAEKWIALSPGSPSAQGNGVQSTLTYQSYAKYYTIQNAKEKDICLHQIYQTVARTCGGT